MLPDNFDFALLPTGSASYSLNELGMLQSTIEDIDRAFVDWVKDLQLSTLSNEGFTSTPVLWQVPERSYQIKNKIGFDQIQMYQDNKNIAKKN